MLLKEKVLAAALIALLGLSGCQDRPIEKTTPPVFVDADGDGLTSDVDPDDNDACNPSQLPGYSDYDNSNPIWQAEDCDGDGYLNGSEDNNTMEDFANPLSDPYDPLDACFIFENFKYCELHADDSKIWLDRNLQASKVCEDANDTECYGTLYQWGRGADGHESRTSETYVGPIDIEADDNRFTTMHDPDPEAYNDWGVDDDNGTVRATAWAENSHALLSICPVGWNVPTGEELENVIALDGIIGVENALDGKLKLAPAGKRASSDEVDEEGTSVYLWSSDAVGQMSRVVFLNTGRGTKTEDRSLGYSVRCIKQ